MASYTAQQVSVEQVKDIWCDVCEEAKHPFVWLVPDGARPHLQPGEAPGLLLCTGCGEGLHNGDRVDDYDISARRHRRRGSQEP